MKNTYIKSIFDVANMFKKITVKDVPVNNHAFLNIQAESPFLPEQNMLCIVAIEYNSNLSNGKIVVDLSFIIKIQQILCLYMYAYQNIKRVL